MQLKHTVIALAAAGMLSTQAYASEMQVDAALQPGETVAAFTDADIQAMFEQEAGQPMQLAALSQQEMRETEGAWMNFAIGGAIGFGAHALSHGRNMTFRSAAIATGTGALTGGVGGALIRASGGGFAGNVAWRPNMLATNFGVSRVNNPSRR